MAKVLKIDTRFIHQDLHKRAEELLAPACSAFSELVAKTCRGREWTGFWDYPQQHGFELNKKIHTYINTIPHAYDAVILLGIGGSLQGVLAMHDALASKNTRVQLLFGGYHLSAALTTSVLDQLSHLQPLLVVVSKSGETLETAVAFRILRHYLEKRYGKSEACQRTIVVTDPEGGSLRAFSKEHNCQAFSIPTNIGGRYSVLTAAGLVPLAIAGHDTEMLLKGANAFYSEMISTENPAVIYAAMRNAAYQADKRVEVLSYCDPRLRSLADWWKQLFGESEGKNNKGMLPTTLALTSDLHALGQYLQDGHRNMLETFLVVDDIQSATTQVPHDYAQDYLAGKSLQELNSIAINSTRLAHHDGNVPNMSVQLSRLDAFGLGYLFAFWQTACAVSGALLGVNPFDQEGVEYYKRNMLALAGKAGLENEADKLRARLH